jgi:hypothetical protein
MVNILDLASLQTYTSSIPSDSQQHLPLQNRDTSQRIQTE